MFLRVESEAIVAWPKAALTKRNALQTFRMFRSIVFFLLFIKKKNPHALILKYQSKKTKLVLDIISSSGSGSGKSMLAR